MESSRNIKQITFWSVLVISLLLQACAGTMKKAENYEARQEWLKAVLEYRKAHNRDPGNVEFSSRLRQAELKAADFYYQKGFRHFESGNYDAAVQDYQRGLTAKPEHSKLLQAMNRTLAEKQALQLVEEAGLLEQAKRLDQARDKLSKAAKLSNKKEVQALLKQLEKKIEDSRSVSGLALKMKTPITLNFNKTRLRQAFEFIARSFGVNVIFDEEIKDQSVTLFAKNVSFEQALDLMFATTKTFYKKVADNTVLIAPDNKSKRGQYEDHMIRVFQMTDMSAKKMADIIKGLLTVDKMIVNEHTNTIIVRDKENTLALVEKLIKASDRKRAELILDVEILEVNRQKAENLGLDFGTYQASAHIPDSTVIPLFGKKTDLIKSTAVLTLPSLTFRFYKQDVDAKILANPKVRVVSGKNAKIHIGDRVPLRASTITDATGQVRTTYEYKDIGIRLVADPTVNLDNSVGVKLGLEVSTLGENLGTADDPAFRIGTRNADTYMLLRDGETAILGGLIRDEDRDTVVRVPGLGDIPIVGAAFSNLNSSGGRTDVLLTITPRVVRGWDIPAESLQAFYSGTAERYMDRPIFAALKTAGTDAVIAQGGAPGTPQAPAGKEAAAIQLTKGLAPSVPVLGPVFGFAKPAYSVNTDSEVDVALTISGLSSVKSIPIELLYNDQLLDYISAQKGDIGLSRFKATREKGRAVLKVDARVDETGKPLKGVLGTLKFKGKQPGVSYLVYRLPALKTVDGKSLEAQLRASRVIVK
jgi:general secretion pathway protein D